jgi:hypothetical protein
VAAAVQRQKREEHLVKERNGGYSGIDSAMFDVCP